MAKSLSKSGITTGNTVRAWHVTQSIDAFAGNEAYDVTLSGSMTLTGSLIFDTTISEGNHYPGRLQWNTTDNTLDLDLIVSGSTLQIGQEVLVYARNESGVTINNGEVVRIVGSTGQKVTIEKAIATSVSINTPDRNEIIGVATQDISNNSFGYVTRFGNVRDIDTSGLTEGEICYVSHLTSGSITNTKPPAPYSVIKVGVVEITNVNNGRILVDPFGPIHMNDITGITGSNIPTGTSYWAYNSTTGVTTLSNAITASSFSGSFVGDGSGLTTIGGPNSSLSGSFSGSFVGDGSGLTGVSGDNFANANLTFTGNRTHDTNGNSLLISSDGATQLQFNLYGDSSYTQYSFGNNYIQFFNNGIEMRCGNNKIFDSTTSEATFNGAGANIDFRVKGQTDVNLFFIDASTDRVGVKTSTPSNDLEINGGLTITSTQGANTGSGDYFQFGTGGRTKTIYNTTGQSTSDASYTTIYTIPVPSNRTFNIESSVSGRKVTGAQSGSFTKISGTFFNSGSLRQIGSTTTLVDHSDFVSKDVRYLISGTDVLLQVRGQASENISWYGIVDIVNLV